MNWMDAAGVSGTGILKRQQRRRAGHILLIMALILPAMMAVAGLALDGGMLYQLKRRMQAAADAGAMGAAQELWRGNSSSDQLTAAARMDSRLNGFENGVNGTTVTVNRPPTTGAWAGNNSYIEVVVSRTLPTTFLRILGSQRNTVRARAVSTLSRYVDFCVLALDPSAPLSLTVGGTGTMSANCGVMVNSTNPVALLVEGGGCLTSTSIGVSGGYLDAGSVGCLTPEPVSNTPPALDPLATMTPPDPASAPVKAFRYTQNGGNSTLLPGLYQDGIKVLGGVVDFLPGVYIIDGGGFTLGAGTVARGEGVMFYLTDTPGPGTWGRIQIDGAANCNLRAPDSGDYEGILFWADRNTPDIPSTQSMIVGTPSSTFEGVIYTPSADLLIAGGSNAANWTILIADTISVQGNVAVPGNFEVGSITPPIRKPTLVE